MNRVEARSLCVGDVVVTSDGWRLRVIEWELNGDRVSIRFERQFQPFSVPVTTRFQRESGSGETDRAVKPSAGSSRRLAERRPSRPVLVQAAVCAGE